MNVLAYVHLRNIVNSTGAGRVARQMTESLAKVNGVQLRVLADSADYRQFVPEAGQPWTKFQYHLFQNETSRQQALWYLFRSPGGERFWPEAQIVYCTGESYVPVKKARLVVTMHDAAHFESDAHAKTAAQWKQRFKWKLLFGTLADKADMFHTVSQFSADRLAHYFPSMRGRLRVVHNAVNERFFEPTSEKGQFWLQKVGLAGRRYILVPGGLHYRKNAELVLDGWERLAKRDRDVQLAIINHSDPAYMDRAKALGDRVHLLGYVCDEQLCSLYNAATLVWFPSRYEGFGMPVLEAMACGAPVVASNSSAIPEVAGDAAILASPTNSEEHVDALLSLLNDESTRLGRAARGRQHAAQFRWAESARRLHAEFRSLI